MKYNVFEISIGTYDKVIPIVREARCKERLKDNMKKLLNARREYEEFIIAILRELAIALTKYPDSRWPWKSFDFIHQCSVMMEEAGEVVRAANNMREGGDWESLYKELAQTAAMCLRIMNQVKEYGLRLDKESGSPLSDR